MEDDFGVLILTSRESNDVVRSINGGVKIVDVAGGNGVEKILEHTRFGEVGLDVVVGIGEAVDAKNLPNLVGGGARSAEQEMIWVALPSFGEDIFQTAEHGTVLTAVSIDDGVVVIGFGVLESLIAVVKEDPAGTISSAAKTVVQIVRVVGMLNDRIVDIGAGEMEPSDGLGVLLLELGEISS